jgi:hypothetical protein
MQLSITTDELLPVNFGLLGCHHGSVALLS